MNSAATAMMPSRVAPGGQQIIGPSPDADGDELPDEWESGYFDVAQYGAEDDPDSDGASNLDEWAAGTSPVDGTDRLRLTIKSVSPARFGFNGKQGRGYVLERWSGEPGADWEEAASQGPLASDQVVEMTDETAPPLRAFYRLRVELP